MTEGRQAHRDQRSLRRRNRGLWRWMFRLAAIGLGLGVFALMEVTLHVLDIGSSASDEDPFVEFASVRPLFERTADGGRFHTSPSRRKYFKEDSFAVQKPKGEFRVFVFGGSTVQGNPFSIETSFPTYLQIALEEMDPRHSWRVVNCGGVSYSSYRLVPIMQECLAYEPDLFIFCEGHNEFLEDVTYREVRNSSSLVQSAFLILNQFRSFRALRQAVLAGTESAEMGGRRPSANGSDSRPVLPEDVDTLLDHDGGFSVYHRDDARASVVAEHFRNNLIRMAAICRENSLPLLLLLPPSNDSDCPPFKPQFSDALSANERQTVADLLHHARDLAAAEKLDEAIASVQSAIETDRRYALTWYELGHLQSAAKRFDEAREAFQKASDEDTCPLRMTSPLEEAMQQVAIRYNVPMIDIHKLLQSNSVNGIVGDNVLVDHVHPSFRGHEEIAIEIAEWMLSAGYVRCENRKWKDSMRMECQSRLQALDNLYFLRGQRALENLRHWAAGRSGGPPLRPRSP